MQYRHNLWPTKLSFLIITLLLVSCSGSSKDTGNSNQDKCSRSQIETSLTNTLSTITTDVDFSFYIEDSEEESFSYNRGTSTLDTPYRSASTSKWVAAAAILQLVDDGTLDLSDQPHDYLSASEWTIDSEDSLYAITLADLLSFTSGLTEQALCTSIGAADFYNCLSTISDNNLDNGEIPENEFYYGPNHLQLAGAMAVKAGGFSDWAELFSAFKTDTGLFANSDFNLPSTSNPRLAGGMTWTGKDYIDFIRDYKNSEFYSSTHIVENATSDQLGGVTIVNSPAADVGLDWHYGQGLWIECDSPTFDCTEVTQVSSAGAFGAYPLWNIEHDFIALVAREGALTSFKEGYDLYKAVQEDVEAWVLCPPSSS